MSDVCLNCNGLIPEHGVSYGYAGKYCYCQKPPEICRPASKEKVQMTPDSKSVRRWKLDKHGQYWDFFRPDGAEQEIHNAIDVVEASAYDAVVAQKDAEIASLKKPVIEALEASKARLIARGGASKPDDFNTIDALLNEYEAVCEVEKLRIELARLRASEERLLMALTELLRIADMSWKDNYASVARDAAREALAELEASKSTGEKGRG